MTIFDNLEPSVRTIFEDNGCTCTIQEGFLTDSEASDFFDYFLKSLDWQHDTAKIYGKTIITKRKIVWYSDAGLDYNYSGASRVGDGSWDPRVLGIKNRLESETGYQFNSCLLNLYHSGDEAMGWHSDDQNHLEPSSPVCIVSLGAQRFFRLRMAADKVCKHKILLPNGSILSMLGQTQQYWQHEISKSATIKEPRISLTFRMMKRK